MRKLLRDTKPNETKLNELKKKYIVRTCRRRGNTSIWNNSGATARSNDLKLQKGQKISCQRYDCCCYSKLIGKLMDAVILLANATTEVNLRQRERLKPELHPSYCHLCNTFQVIWGRLPQSCRGQRWYKSKAAWLSVTFIERCFSEQFSFTQVFKNLGCQHCFTLPSGLVRWQMPELRFRERTTMP